MVPFLIMVGEESRRTFLRESAATGAIIAPPLQKYWRNQQNRIRIESNGGGFAVYEFAVTGSVRQEDGGDHVNGNRVYGNVGPDRGTDTFSYSGEITGLELAGPATLIVNGKSTNPRSFPPLSDSITSQNIPQGNHRLRIKSNGGGVAAYEFTVNGSVSQEDGGDQVTGNQVYGHVGPDRGTDTFTYSGTITQFALTGPATLFVDGQEVTPQTNPSDSSQDSTSVDALEGYRQAAEELNSLAENPGEPTDEEWSQQMETRIQQVQNTIRQLVEQDYRFTVEVGDEVTVHIEDPSSASFGTGFTPAMTLAFSIGAIKLLAIYQALNIAYVNSGTLVNAAQTVTFPSASQAISTLFSTPWVFMLVQLNRQQAMIQGARCLVSNEWASQLSDTADTPQLESWAEKILEQTGTCPRSFNRFHNLAQDVFNIIEDNTDDGGNQGSIEYLDCRTVRFTGSFQDTMIYWSAYTPSVVTNQDSAGSVSGSKTFSIADIPGVPSDAKDNAVIDAVEAYTDSDALTSDPDLRKNNPNRNECTRQAKPDQEGGDQPKIKFMDCRTAQVLGFGEFEDVIAFLEVFNSRGAAETMRVGIPPESGERTVSLEKLIDAAEIREQSLIVSIKGYKNGFDAGADVVKKNPDLEKCRQQAKSNV